MVRHLQIIGEAAGRFSDDARSRHPDISWQKIAGMGHVLVHGYFEVDLELVWSVIEHDLAVLRSAINLMVDRSRPDSGPEGHGM